MDWRASMPRPGRLDLYSLQWDNIRLQDYKSAVAPFGGPIALVRDDTKLVSINKGTSGRRRIMIYSSSGQLLREIPDDKPKLVSIGWLEDERLACVYEDGIIRIYNILGAQGDFVSFNTLRDKRIIDCQILPTVIVVLTSELDFIVVSSMHAPRMSALAKTGLTSRPTSWLALDPRKNSNSFEVFFSDANGIQRLTRSSSVAFPPNNTICATRMAITVDLSYLALVHSTNQLHIFNTQTGKSFDQFLYRSEAPTAMSWCSNHVVLLHWPGELLCVTPDEQHSFPCLPDEHLVLAPEPDSMRVFSSTNCSLVQMVPKSVESIFSLLASSPASSLYEAFRAFENKSPDADTYLRRIKHVLKEAVDGCLAAASEQFCPRSQAQLLKAASFGKCFIDAASGYDHGQFGRMCNWLRVLKAVRHHSVGIPMTYFQVTSRPADELIRMLTRRHMHLLALRIAQFLNHAEATMPGPAVAGKAPAAPIRVDQILVDWAREKVRQSTNDEELCWLIREKFRSCPGVAYADVADMAFQTKRERLAENLLEFEPHPGRQVPLLLKMGKNEKALQRAIESGDPDMINELLGEMSENMSPTEFLALFKSNPAAVPLLESFCLKYNRSLLRSFYYQYDRHVSVGSLLALQKPAGEGAEARIKDLKAAFDQFQLGGDSPALRSTADALAGFTQDEIKLQRFQQDLDLLAIKKKLSLGVDRLPATFVGLTYADTLRGLFFLDHALAGASSGAQLGTSERAFDFFRQYKIPDRQYWWVKLDVCCLARNWPELERMVGSAKNPIGFQAFVDGLLAGEAPPSEVAKYVKRLPAAADRARYFSRIMYWKEAHAAAVEAKDLALLEELRAACRDREVVVSFDRSISQMQSRR
ncbi:hypothetical protein H696_02818 [Fonticula alba]|uniref:Vacuolar protein sorting-associated protein 16 homolog n=1 Tax=Fonticula alba TaxID=691883 RepID=A0A058ZAM4_FONAL|nr:hypothetical protein H696_02818 [Fonticula alba]KCV70477.1 hypothetical protein H696_02818 [Fonticula alba]|eukprot:XP_009494993.1 hypothetical protein H696_02818 [Fonticula alba]